MVSKAVYLNFLRSYKHFLFFRKKSILEGDFGVSGFLGLISTVFCKQKNTRHNKEQNGTFFLQKTKPFLHSKTSKKVKRFYTQKHQKNSMSKNGVKSRLTLLF